MTDRGEQQNREGRKERKKKVISETKVKFNEAIHRLTLTWY